MSGRTKTLLAVISAIAGLSLLPVPVNAAVRCKSALVSTGAISQSQAITAWSKRVRNMYGAAWSDFGLARAKSYSEQPLAVATMYFVSARPCRRY